MEKYQIIFTNHNGRTYKVTAKLIEFADFPELTTRVTINMDGEIEDSYWTDSTPEQICDKYRRLMYLNCYDYQEMEL